MRRGLRNFSRRLHGASLFRWTRARLAVAATLALAAVVVCAWMFRTIGGHGQVAGFGVTPDREEFPVRGIDVSAHNGVIDFTKVAADSVSFIYIKATEGADFKDRAFVDNYRRARRTGLPVGVYHFFRFDAPGRLQAYNLMHSLRGRPTDLPVAIDVEEWLNSSSHAPELVAERLNEMVDVLESYGYTVAVYSNKKGLARYLRPAGMAGGKKRPLWICSFSSPPLPEEDNGSWTLWQHTHRGRVAGIDGFVDLNVFRGSRSEWAEWLEGLPSQPQ